MSTAETVKEVLGRLDHRRDGTLDIADLKEVMLKHAIVSDRDFTMLFNKLDVDMFGRVAFTNVVDVIFRPEADAAKPQTSRRVVHHAHATKQSAVPTLLPQFHEIDNGKVQAEYVWLHTNYWDGHSFVMGSRALTLQKEPTWATELPIISYEAGEFDVHLVPRQKYKDPFRRGGVLILADTHEGPASHSIRSHGAPTDFNSRILCEEIMAQADDAEEEPWFGMEQEYYLLDPRTNLPLGCPKNRGFPDDHESYYCSIGAHKTVGRDVAECHYRACLHAGINISGMNSGGAPGKWCFQVGPCAGVQAADELWMARYILQRICEMFQIAITFAPKPVPGWSGLTCSTSYSTRSTRNPNGGMEAINTQIEQLQQLHAKHLAVYKKGNNRRLSGTCDTLAVGEFSRSTDRSTSIRVSSQVEAVGHGPYEDRRPAANADPYLVTRMLVETTLCLRIDQESAASEPAIVDSHPETQGDLCAEEEDEEVRTILSRPSRRLLTC